MTSASRIVEEEMVRLAEEMSLMDEFDLSFNPRDLTETRDRIRVYEEILDEQMGAREREDIDDEDGRISDSQLKALFFSHDDDIASQSSSRRGYSSRRSSDRITPGSAPSRWRETKMRDTAATISRTLRWYQGKIVNEIEKTSENKNLAALLELNDRVTQVLAKADYLSSVDSLPHAQGDHSFSYSSHMSFVDHAADFYIDRHSASAENLEATVNSAVYAVRRGVSREEISSAVADLIRLGNFNGNVSLPAVKKITAAGALQALLVALSRATEWPDVELQLSKVISVLVTHEDDWSLLQRSAVVILTSLYTLELKTQTRARTLSEAQQMAQENDFRQVRGRAGTLDLDEEVAPCSEDLLELDPTHYDLSTHKAEAAKQSQDIRALIAAAVAKLSLVLASEWSVHPFPFGDFSVLSMASGPATMSSTLSIYDHSHAQKARYRAQSKAKEPVKDAVQDNNRTLDVLLNLILTMSDASLSHVGRPVDSIEPSLFTPLTKSAGMPTLNRQTSKDQPPEPVTRKASFLSLSLSSDVDAFLRDYLGITTHALMAGQISQVKCPIDRSAIMCSSALATLAEVPQCRPGLVTGGALRILRGWLELGTYVFDHIRALALENLEECDKPAFVNRIMTLFAPTFDLLTNACAALMYITGGTDGRFGASPTSSLLGGGRDYVVGWIDAQLLAEGLPDVLVRMVLSSHQSFLSPAANALPTANACVLPAVISMYVTQTLFQLCSRANNRQRLQGNVIPFACCMVFESTAERVRLMLVQDRNRELNEDEDNSVSLCRAIFEYGNLGLSPTQNAYNQGNSLSLHNPGNSPLSVSIPSPLPLPGSGRDQRDLSGDHTPMKGPGRTTAHRSASEGLPSGPPPVTIPGHGPSYDSPVSAFFAVVSSITSSALDCITYYFSDEVTRREFLGLAALPSYIPPGTGVLNGAGEHILLIPKAPLIDIMCAPRIIAALSLATSYLPRGHGRLSCVRVISSLTDWPASLTVLYEGNVMDVLAWIASEAEEVQHPFTPPPPAPSTAYDTREPNSSLFGSFFSNASNKLSLERGTSNNSTISAISSSCTSGQYRGNNSYRSRSHSWQKAHHGLTAREEEGEGSICTLPGGLDEEEMETQKMSMEETLTVCYALANLCEAREAYAMRMFNSGLFTIMTRLAYSKHMEVTRQALRCMHAMCRVIALTTVASTSAAPTTPQAGEEGAPTATTATAVATAPSAAIMTSASGRGGGETKTDLSGSKSDKPMTPNSQSSPLLSYNTDHLWNALEVLSSNLRSPGVLVQKGALLTIAQLALIGYDMQDRIVDGCLRTVVSMAVDPANDRDVRSAAEDVLRNMGFAGGVKDLEICGFDFQILRDWYSVSRSLRPQQRGLEVLRTWVKKLFMEEPVYVAETGLETGFSNILLNEVDEAEDVFALLHEAASVLHARVEHSDRPGYLKDIDGSSQPHSGGLGLNMSIPHLQRHLTDSFLKLLPFCAPKHLFDNSSHGSSDSGHGHGHGHGHGQGSSAHGYSTSKAHSTSPMGVPHQRMSRHAGPSTAIPRSTNQRGGGAGGGTHSAHGGTYHSWDHYRWVDRPPIAVTYLLDLFYTSKMHQLVLMDLTSLGASVPVAPTSTTVTSGIQEEDEVYLIPQPAPVQAVLLPARSYQSFARVGRVLQRLFETQMTSTCRHWSLSFSDSDFHGDFHTSLLATLQRCPMVISLSFSSGKVVEEDALLGHLIGHIPSSVRFVSFKATLSKESVQAMCILLRSHNDAFVGDYDDWTHLSLGGANGNGNGNGNSATTQGTPVKTKRAPGSGSTHSGAKGLLGLALTHMAFESNELEHVLELLTPRPLSTSSHPRTPSGSLKHPGTPPPAAAVATATATASTTLYSSTPSNGKTPRGGGGTTPTALQSPPATQAMAFQSMTSPPSMSRGLRYLDLSHNRLSDSQCATVLTTALRGPLEGLELGGNWIYRAVKFMEACDVMLTHPGRLRYLGLSQNNLTHRALSSLLYKLAGNTTLTSLDLSANNIESSSSMNDLLRTFLRKNAALRVLDLSYNKLVPDTVKEMELGLLENHTLLLMPLAGNTALDYCKTVGLVQKKLHDNRLLYKHFSDEWTTSRASLVGLDEDDGQDVPEVVAVPLPVTGPGSNNGASSGNGVAAEGRGPGGSAGNLASSSSLAAATTTAATAASPASSPATTTTATAAAKCGPGDYSEDMPSSMPPSSVSSVLREGDGGLASLASASALAQASSPLQGSLSVTGPVSSGEMAQGLGAANHRPGPPLSQSHASHSPPPTALASSSAGSLPSAARPSLPALPHSLAAEPKSIVPASFNEAKAEARTGPGDTSPALAQSASSASSSSSTSSLSGAKTAVPPTVTPHDALPPAPPANTLHVLFSAPLAGFDRMSKAHPLEVLDYHAERDTLCQVMKEVHRDVSVHFHFATTDALRTILSFGCRALHFSGHGLPNGLCFEDGRSGLQVVKVQQLRDLLGAGGLGLDFVFVSACYSKEIGQAFVKAGVPHVVCVKVDSKIQDAAAIAFTRAFYVALLTGRTVRASFDIAKEALKASPYVPNSILEGEKFILLPDHHDLDSSTDPDLAATLHSKSIFTCRPVADWPLAGQCTMGPNRINMDAFLACCRLPSPPADFEGREVAMNTLIRHVLDRRLVSLVGEDGMGKSAVAAAVCHYLYDREVFPQGIVYLRAKGVRDFVSFLAALKTSLSKYAPASVRGKLLDASSSSSAASASSASSSSSSVVHEEEALIACLASARLLLVLDHLDELLGDYGDSVTDMRLFLGRLFEQCAQVKVLHVSVDTLAMRNITLGFGIVEYSVHLGPLTLHSSLRLFARLAPALTTAQEKTTFIEALLPMKHGHGVGLAISREGSSTAVQILKLFGDGNPSKIVHMACQSTHDSVEALKAAGMRMIRHALPEVHGALT